MKMYSIICRKISKPCEGSCSFTKLCNLPLLSAKLGISSSFDLVNFVFGKRIMMFVKMAYREERLSVINKTALTVVI